MGVHTHVAIHPRLKRAGLPCHNHCDIIAERLPDAKALTVMVQVEDNSE